MHSIWFGEFMGTLVLILFGNGVNAAVLLRKSYAADSGWMVITTGWALAVLCGVLVAQAFGSGAANLNPAITLAGAVVTGNYAQLPRLLVRAIAGRNGRRRVGRPALRAALATHARPGGQAHRLRDQSRRAQPPGKHLQRDAGHGSAGRDRGWHLLPRCGHQRPCCGNGPVACRRSGVGHRTLARRHYRLCHQPRARSRAAHRSRAAAHSRQRRIELALRVVASLATSPAGLSQVFCCASRTCRCRNIADSCRLFHMSRKSSCLCSV